MEEIGLQKRQQLAEDYKLIEQAITFLELHFQEQPSLDQIAASVGMSAYYFQRVFTRWVGISPKRFLQFLTKEHARQLLDRSVSILEASYQSGLSGPGRLHDLFVALEAVTPGEYKSGGAGIRIGYSFHPTPFGECMLALTDRGICGLSFVVDQNREEVLDDLRRRWFGAKLESDDRGAAELINSIFWSQGADVSGFPRSPLRLVVSGTNFQIKVWEALLRIPPGSLTTYQGIASYLGVPQAARAVGMAVGANPISYLIPCHRVIRKMGVFGGYRWGTARKKAILGWELAHSSSAEGESS